MTNEELISMAKKAMENSYSPYSEFKVGAAALGKSGTVYTGVNIENASYGATVCAERCAMFKGISEGEKGFSKIAVVCGTNRPAPPCGMCLQVMTEFMEPETGEILLEENGGIKVYKLKELIPLAFKL
ncbi:MAG: cytidine deaminase [Firmicutes bacterium]|nr:cytidine deaminase [Bacillota bacterium]